MVTKLIILLVVLVLLVPNVLGISRDCTREIDPPKIIQTTT